MRRICLTLPTNRPCAATIAAMLGEARYAVENFDVEVRLLVLDSSDKRAYARHAQTIAGAPRVPGVIVSHLDEAAQRRLLHQIIERADVAKPELIAELMLPAGLSYGACTNRAFVIGTALGCESIHRRDSDSRYQVHRGATIFPIHHELASLGTPAADVARVAEVSEHLLDPVHGSKPVVMVGGSFVGELSVDIGEIRDRDPGIYYDVVSLWAPGDASAAEKRALVDESFSGAGNDVFTHDRSLLTIVDPMRVDMCNISLYQVHEDIPLPPATDTIGSDYFLLHVIHHAGLPGVLHNRHIVNFHTAERKSDSGFMAYQTRLAKFFLSMLYLHFIYQRMAAAGASLLDERYRVRVSRIIEFVRESAWLSREDNARRLGNLERAYRRLGGRYAAFADVVTAHRQQLLEHAQRDIEDFATLIEAWEPLMRASRAVGVE